MKPQRFYLSLFVVMFVLSACAPAVPAATPTPVPPTPTATTAPTATPTPTATPVPAPITFTGRVTNMAELTPFYTEKSFLQIVPISDDGKVTFSMGVDGTSLVSDLAKCPLPGPDGNFKLEMKELKPGKYMISMQMVKINKMQFQLMVMSKQEGDKKAPITFTFPADPQLPFYIEFGDIFIQTP